MTRLLVALIMLTPMSLLAHTGHESGGPSSIGDVLHYVFSFDHYAGTIAVVVAGAGFIAYRNLRRKISGKKNEASAEC